MIAFFTTLKLRNEAFSFALRTALAVQPRTERRDEADKILDQVFVAVLSQIDHFDAPVLHAARQQLLNGVEAKASQAVFVFHHSAARSASGNQRQGRVGQHFQQLGPRVLHPGANVFDYRADLIAFGRARRRRLASVWPALPDSLYFQQPRRACRSPPYRAR